MIDLKKIRKKEPTYKEAKKTNDKKTGKVTSVVKKNNGDN
jgi:hypothetical protein